MDNLSLILVLAASLGDTALQSLRRLEDYSRLDRLGDRVIHQVEAVVQLLKKNESNALDGRPHVGDIATILEVAALLRKVRSLADQAQTSRLDSHTRITLLELLEQLKGRRRFLKSSLREPSVQTRVLDTVPLDASISSLGAPSELSSDSQETSRLHLFVEPPPGQSCDLDVVFVHGFNGHYERTWKAATKLWPVDFLPKDVPWARVFSFEYSVPSLHEHRHRRIAKDLLSHVHAQRSDQPDRKILWIAHSLGGIIVKSALVQSWKQRLTGEPDASMSSSTAGIVFFGTPHQSTSPSAWSTLYESIATTTTADTKSIKETSRFVQDMADKAIIESDDFKSFMDARGIPIVSFFESKPMDITGWVALRVVDSFTRLHHPKEDVRFLEGNHISICKFQDSKEGNYLQVLGVIKGARKQLGIPGPHQQPEFLSWLPFDESQGTVISGSATSRSKEIDIEDVNIPDTYSEFREFLGVPRVFPIYSPTSLPKWGCWVLESDAVKKWISDKGPQLLPITGPHGCGKTSIVRGILQHLEATLSDETPQRTSCVISFIFRGEERLSFRQKPIRSARFRVLKTFVAQLLDRNNDLMRHVIRKIARGLPAKSDQKDESTRTTPGSRHIAHSIIAKSISENVLLAILRSMLEDMCHAEAKVYCVIDALDECDSASVQSIVHMLDSLSSIQGLKTLVAYTTDSLKDLPWELPWRKNPTLHLANEPRFLEDMRTFFEDSMTTFIENHSLKTWQQFKLSYDRQRNILKSRMKPYKESGPITSYKFIILMFQCLALFPSTTVTQNGTANITRWPSLDIIYGLLLRNIMSKLTPDIERRTLVVRALDFLSCAYEPLRPSDLRNALAYADDNPEGEIRGTQESGLAEVEEELGQLVFLNGEGLHLCSDSLRAFLRAHGADHFISPLHKPEKTHALETHAIDKADKSHARIKVPNRNVEEFRPHTRVHALLARASIRFVIACYKDENLGQLELPFDIPFLRYAKYHWLEHFRDAKETGTNTPELLDIFTEIAELEKELRSLSNNPNGVLPPAYGSVASTGLTSTVEPTPEDQNQPVKGESSNGADFLVSTADQFETTYQAPSQLKSPEPFLGTKPDESSLESELMTAALNSKESNLDKLLEQRGDLNSKLKAKLLRRAIQQHKLPVVTKLLNHFEKKLEDHTIHTLEIAVEEGNLDVVKLVISRTATTKINLGKSLHVAATFCKESICDYLLSYGAEVNQRVKDSTVLHIAAASGSLSLVINLVRWGAKPSARDGNLRKPIHCAAETGREDITLYLRSIGSKTEDVDGHGRTPLFVACAAGSLPTVKVLHNDGCDLLRRDRSSRTMLHAATQKAAKYVVKYLLETGCPVNDTDKFGATPLHEAARRGWSSIVNLLLEKDADPHARDKDGETPLHYACKGENATEVVKSLLASSADPNERTNSGVVPLHYAAQFATADIITLLVQNGAEVDEQDSEGLSALHIACASRLAPLNPTLSRLAPSAKVRAILSQGATTSLPNQDGKTPLEYAIEQKQDPDIIDSIRLLLNELHSGQYDMAMDTD
jgi:ankyrin repeat protein